MAKDGGPASLLARKGSAAPSFAAIKASASPDKAVTGSHIRLPSASATGPGPTAQDGPRPRVVVIAADTLGRKLLRALVAAHGCEVAMLGPADSPFAHVMRGRPDLVVVDLDVGPFAARDLAFRIKADPKLRGTRVVAVADSAMPAAGYDALLEKPLSAPAVAHALGRFTRRAASAG
jgi:CheY-like chemotaxis protein